MKKLLVLFTLFNCILSAGFAQIASADSLKQLLSAAQQDTSRVLLMNLLGRSYRYSRPDTALAIAGRIKSHRKCVPEYWQLSQGIGSLFRSIENFGRPKG